MPARKAHPIRLTFYAAVAGVLLAWDAAAAHEPRWIPATPDGGSLSALERAPSSPTTLFALIGSGDLFATTDSGVTWSQRESRRFHATIYGLAVDPTDPDTVVAVAHPEKRGFFTTLLRTHDGGRSWQPLGFSTTVQALTFDPVHPHLLYGFGSGVERSLDGGQTWTPLGLAGLPVSSFAVDPRDGQTLLAAVASTDSKVAAVIWRSSDQGRTWRSTSVAALPPGQPSDCSSSLVFDRSRKDTAYLFGAFGIGQDLPASCPPYRTQDGGRTWEALPSAMGVIDLASAPDGRLYAATELLGVAHSDDGGATWEPPLISPATRQVVPPDAIGIVVGPVGSSADVFAAGSLGVWRSTTRGQEWVSATRGMVSLDASSILSAPNAPASLLAAVGHGIFASHDRGRDWELLSTDYEQQAQPSQVMAFGPYDRERVYGFGFDGLVPFLGVSRDGGRSWVRSPVPDGCCDYRSCNVDLAALAIDPLHPETLLLESSFSQIDTIGCGGEAGAYLVRSEDDGATWSILSTTDGFDATAVAPTAPHLLYGLSCGRLFASRDFGATWSPLANGLPCAHPELLVVDPTTARTLYIGGAGVYRSLDGGATFHPLGHALRSATVSALVVDPRHPSKAYAGVAGQGVWSWDAALEDWAPLDLGLPPGSFSGALALAPEDPTALYAGTTGHGVYRLVLPEGR
jgi:photosystem II stability/assembly factor-like uncharacterized protein